MATKTLDITLWPGEEVTITVRTVDVGSGPRIFVMTARPFEVPLNPAWQRAGIHGLHLRYPQNGVSLDLIRRELDDCERLGLKAILVLAVHSARGGPHTQYTKRLPNGVLIPDYWSDVFLADWLERRRRLAEAVKDHPALWGVGHDFGLDDESWPYKPWTLVYKWELDVWDYLVRYIRAAWELAKMFAPKPVWAQCTPMQSHESALSVLFNGARSERPPDNLGMKHNGLRLKEWPYELSLKRWWEVRQRMGIPQVVEPGLVPTGSPDQLRQTALGLLRRAEEWGAAAINLQKPFITALGAD